ncbi:riboflavin synthase [Bythopirellula goksoeyrii]|uniref:Riboflavin synthase n=1 Tax=Bythopirellula goksoeyrii TaxID=1400387 RepID=A0A5B9QG37_9BACT|nr:riboflavin synthase [Bythopirellula goksoeyrii]QEG36605.1 Riboflavin synthase [Bythopirellula goksoeyrii]
MFTGLVESLATVRNLASQGPGVRLEITDALTAARSAVGDSIAINGCCLTVVALDEEVLAFEAGEETLLRTTLGNVSVGDRVNLETSLCLGDELGGHLVTGHVDGVGAVEERIDDAEWSKFWLHVPGDLTRQMASKGSVAVDGVSLTLVDVERHRFSVALIPHTLKVTTLGLRQVGDRVNLETDVLAKYVARQLAWQSEK